MHTIFNTPLDDGYHSLNFFSVNIKTHSITEWQKKKREKTNNRFAVPAPPTLPKCHGNIRKLFEFFS